jgi:putative MFS transporter
VSRAAAALAPDPEPRALAWRVTLFAGLAFATNGLNLGVLSFALPGLRTAWALPPWQAGLIVAVHGAGQLVGGVTMGHTADWIGRRAGYAATVALSSAAMGAAALVPGLPWLLPLMFVAGIGFGGVSPVAGSMVGEFAPREIRGALMGWTQVIWNLGWIVAALGGVAAHGVEWRLVFAVGALPLVLAAVVPWMVPESPRFLLAHGRRAEAEALAHRLWERFGARIDLPAQEHATRVSLAAHLAELWSPRFRRGTLLLWALWWVMIGAYNGPVVFLPAMLAAQGFAHTDTVSLLISCVMIVPTLAATLLLDRVGRKPVFVAALALGVVGAAVLGVARTEFGLVLGGIGLAGGVLAAWPVILVYAAELYPTRIRATATGWASAAGRTAGILSPALLGILIREWSSGRAVAMSACAAALLGGIMVVLVFGRETAGQSLEEITGAAPAASSASVP